MGVAERLLQAVAALPPPRPFVGWALSVSVIGGFVLIRGPDFASDTATYAFWADRLITSGFDYVELVRERGSVVSLSYALFVTLVALLKLAFGEAWAWALVLLGAGAMATVGQLLSSLTSRLTGCGAAGWASLVFFLCSLDQLQWAPSVGSDTTFQLFAYTVFLMEARRILGKNAAWLSVFAASAAASLYRPTGIVLFPITVWSWFLASTRASSARRAASLALLVFGLAAGALAAGWLWHDPALWPFSFASREVNLIARGYAEGQVVWDRFDTYHEPPQQLADYWAITADRLVHFFAPGAAAYSVRHWVVQVLFYGPVYLLGGWFVIQLLRGRSGLGDRERDVFLAAAGAIICYAFFHAVVQVDYDWRYRLPIMPHFILLAAGGVAALLTGMARRQVAQTEKST